MAASYAGPPDRLQRTDGLAEWFRRSHDWIGSLKPKPTKRPSRQ